MDIIAGVDEVGRGPLAGDVYAGAVILDPQQPIAGLADSKKLTETRRLELTIEIKAKAIAWAIGIATIHEISQLNIFHASLLAMQRAVAGLVIQPTLALIDGKFCPQLPCAARAIIKGDQSESAISAASIIAKVTRDEYMLDLHRLYPQYGFDRHKGYGTKYHLQAIAKFGPCAVHRLSFLQGKNKQLELIHET